VQQVERGSYLLSAFFLPLYLSHFLTLFLFLSRSNTRATTAAMCGCVCRADYRCRRCRSRLSDLSAFRRRSARCIRSIDTSEDNCGRGRRWNIRSM
jgi:hypothetical protein